MNIKIVEKNGIKIAVVENSIDELIIKDGKSAMDFIASIGYEHECWAVCVNKSAVSEDFFRLSSGIAGEISQKFANYRFKAVIVGDFSGYTSEPLKDYIFECNKGGCLGFAESEETAIEWLAKI